MRRAEAWTLADLIDLEHLLSAENVARNEDADRRIFEEVIRPRLAPDALDRRPAVFHAWLEARRREISRPTPGQSFDTGWKTLLTLALVGGLLLGGGAAGALLAYSGTEPINAPRFLLCTVGLQVGLLAIGLVAWLGRGWLGPIVGDFSPVRALVSGLLAPANAALRRLPGERREQTREAMGVLARRHEIYGSLAQWPVLLVTQLFGVAFNVGILFMMLAVHLPFKELRFGWQSTYDVSAEQLHRVVSAAAAPWKWATPHAHPSLGEITASRYGHAQSAESLDAAAAKSWWPFLVGAVAVYGLLPRVVLLTLAASSLRRGLRAQRFDHAEANALWRRLTGPLIAVRGGDAVAPVGADSPPASPSAAPAAAGECLALVAQEIPLDGGALRMALAGKFGWQPRAIHSVPIDHRRACGAAFDEVRAAASGLAGVVVVAPAERDPIMAIALFLRDLETAAGPGPELLVLLRGEPRADGSLGPVGEDRLGIWRRFKNVQRLRVGIESWPS